MYPGGILLSAVLCAAVSASHAAGVCENDGLEIHREAISLAMDGECVLSDGFADAGMFELQGLSRKKLSCEFGGDGGTLKLTSLVTNRQDTYWSVLSRQVVIPDGRKRRYRLAFRVNSGVPLSCGAHENGIWRNLIFWQDAAGREISATPVVFSVSGRFEAEVSLTGDIPETAVKFRLQLGFDAPDITPGKSVVYRNLRFYVLPEKPAFVRRGSFVSGLHRGGKVSWCADVPKKTAVGFQYAAGETADEALKSVFIGPDGTTKSYFRKPFKVDKPFMRYRAVLVSADGVNTPRLKTVTVGGRTDGKWTLLGDCEEPLVHLSSKSPFSDALSELSFEILDRSPILRKTLRVCVDGIDRTADARWDGEKVSLSAPSGGWSEGRHEVRVYIADSYGYGREAQKFFFRGEAPRTPKVTLRKDGFAMVDGKVFFPIGLFDVRKHAFNAWNWDRAVGDLAAAGFNLVHSYGTTAFDPSFRAAIRKYGLMHWISSSPWHKGFETERHDPSILAWYLADDTSRNTSPAELFDRVEAVKAFDPTKLTTHAEHVGGSEISITRPYVDKIDGLMAEIYPIRQNTPQVASNCVARVISDMLRHHADVREEGVSPRFIWPIIQYFQGWGSWERFPTRQELRAMSYAAIIHGAHGITWYKYNDHVDVEKKKFNRGIVSGEDKWRNITNLVAEVKALVPVITEGAAAPDVNCRVVAGPKKDPHGHNAVTFMARRHGGRLYVLAVNSVMATLKAHFTASSLPVGEIEVWNEKRGCQIENGKGWTDRFAPFAVHVYTVK